MKTKLLIVLFLISFGIYGQDSTKTKIDLHHYFGAAAGFTTGYGLSYRFFMGRSGVQVNFGPYSARDINTTVSTGVTLLYRIIALENDNIYLYYGNHVLYEKDTYNNWGTGKKYYETSNRWNTGLGLDLELNSSKRVVFNIMVGLGAYNTFETKTLTGEAGIHYKIK